MAKANPQSGMSDDTKTLIVILLLIFVYPVGLILMFMWMKWPMWVKILITVPVLLIPIGILASVMLVAINPSEQLARARDTERMAAIQTIKQGINMYEIEEGEIPQTLDELVPVYLTEVPLDPMDDTPYDYRVTGNDYMLCTEYEAEMNAIVRDCVSLQTVAEPAGEYPEF